jgi:hypothetical protein
MVDDPSGLGMAVVALISDILIDEELSILERRVDGASHTRKLK